MFTQVVDLLVRKRKQRARIVLLILRVLFSMVLTCKLAELLGYDIESWVWATPEQALAKVFDGTYVLAFALFLIVWKVSFGTVHFVLTWFGILVSGGLYRLLANAIHKKPELIHKDWYEPALRVIISIFNMVDVVVIDTSGVRPGSQFYRFYDYLKAVDSGGRDTNEYQASLTISLTIQFLVIYSLVSNQVTLPWYLLVIAIVLLIDLFLTNLTGFVLDTLISIKHRRLLELFAHLDRGAGQNEAVLSVVEEPRQLAHE